MASDYTLAVKFTGDASSLKNATNDVSDGLEKVNSSSTSGTSGIKKFLTAIGAITAVKKMTEAIADLTQQAVELYADYEQLAGGIEKLYGDDATTVIENASEAYKTAGLSANDYMEQVTNVSASLISSLGGDTEAATEYANQAIIDMSDNANTFGTDIESIQNAYSGFAKQNYTMLDNLKLGYAGTKTGMEELLADAEELSGVEYDIDSYADIVEAIHVVQEEMGVAGTTATEAEETISGSISSLSSAWDNLLTGMGDSGSDLTSLIENVVTSAVTVVENVLPVVSNVLTNIPTMIASLIPAILEYLPEFASTAITVIAELINSLVLMLPQILECGIDILLTLIDGIIECIPELIVTIVDVIGQLVETLTEPDTLMSILECGIELLLAVIEGLADAIPTLVAYLPEIISNIVTFVVANLPTIIKMGIQILTALISGIAKCIPSLVKALPEVISAITSAFDDLDMLQIGIDIINGLIDGIKSMLNSVGDAISEVTSSITSSFKDLLGISSPSKVFFEYGEYTDEGYINGLESEAKEIQGAVEDVYSLSLPDVTTYGSNSTIIDTSGLYSTLLSAVQAQESNVTSAIEEGFSNMSITYDSREVARMIKKCTT